YASGRMFRTDWFRFKVEVKDGRVLKLHPESIAARRVRVLETRNSNGKRRRELVMDVVGSANDETAGSLLRFQVSGLSFLRWALGPTFSTDTPARILNFRKHGAECKSLTPTGDRDPIVLSYA